MTLEQQVCSLELAQKLKELGVKQESVFKYCGGHIMYDEDEEGKFEPCVNTDLLSMADEYCHTAGLTCEFTVSAFTVAELGEMLPGFVDLDGRVVVLKQNKSNDGKTYGIYGTLMDGSAIKIEMFCAPTEANARAKMLIYLLENKLITL